MERETAKTGSFFPWPQGDFLLTFFPFKCFLALYDLDLSNNLVTADSSKYNLIHAYYQFKIRCARTNILKFSHSVESRETNERINLLFVQNSGNLSSNSQKSNCTHQAT